MLPSKKIEQYFGVGVILCCVFVDHVTQFVQELLMIAPQEGVPKDWMAQGLNGPRTEWPITSPYRCNRPKNWLTYVNIIPYYNVIYEFICHVIISCCFIPSIHVVYRFWIHQFWYFPLWTIMSYHWTYSGRVFVLEYDVAARIDEVIILLLCLWY